MGALAAAGAVGLGVWLSKKAEAEEEVEERPIPGPPILPPVSPPVLPPQPVSPPDVTEPSPEPVTPGEEVDVDAPVPKPERENRIVEIGQTLNARGKPYWVKVDVKVEVVDGGWHWVNINDLAGEPVKKELEKLKPAKTRFFTADWIFDMRKFPDGFSGDVVLIRRLGGDPPRPTEGTILLDTQPITILPVPLPD